MASYETRRCVAMQAAPVAPAAPLLEVAGSNIGLPGRVDLVTVQERVNSVDEKVNTLDEKVNTLLTEVGQMKTELGQLAQMQSNIMTAVQTLVEHILPRGQREAAAAALVAQVEPAETEEAPQAAGDGGVPLA